MGRSMRGIFILLTVASGAVIVGQSWRQTRPLEHITFAPWQTAGQDRFSEMARRYAPLRAYLAGIHTIGWISSFDHEEGHRMMAQSLLAPTLVVDSDEPHVLIASFHDEKKLQAFLDAREPAPTRRFGRGVALIGAPDPAPGLTKVVATPPRPASAILSLVASAVTGWGALRMLWPIPRGRLETAGHVVRGIMALALGQAIAAGHYLIWRFSCEHVGAAYQLVDCIGLPAIFWLVAWRIGIATKHGRAVVELDSPTGPDGRGHWAGALLLVAGLMVVGAAMIICLARACYEPLGAWDGWAIWNLKARFMFRGGGEWTGMFSHSHWFSHPDYPLLVPASVARLWTYLGAETTIAPQLLSWTFTVMVAALLSAALYWFRGVGGACVGAILLVSFGPFLEYGGSQMSDIPLSLYVLGGTISLALAARATRGAGRLSGLAGLFMGCAMLTKNEAQPILLCLVMAIALVHLREHRSFGKLLLWLATGAVPLALLLVAQKLQFAGSSYLIADQSSAGGMFAKALSPSRHGMIFEFLFRWNLGFFLWKPFWTLPLAIPLPNQPAILLSLAALLLPRFRDTSPDRTVARMGLAFTVFVLLAYYLVFLVMPYDLRTLLESFPRVQLHFWPSLIFSMMLLTGQPGGLGAAEVGQPMRQGVWTDTPDSPVQRGHRAKVEYAI